MQKTYSVLGLTCGNCVASVKEKLEKLDAVASAEVDLEKAEAEITFNTLISAQELQEALSSKYTITGKTLSHTTSSSVVVVSKFSQLKPLFLIFIYLFGAAILLHYKDWNTAEVMLDFMGLFYIVFSFFKLLDLKGFPESFKMYDPLAKVLPVYGWVYPFLELGLGLLFLMRFNIQLALIITVVILGVTTIGVTKTLLDKKSIRCACLGTALNLPMTEATFIENAIMLLMAFWMLLSGNVF